MSFILFRNYRILKYALLFFSLCISFKSIAQKKSKSELKFEKKIFDFKYSLYADLDTVTDLSIFISGTKTKHPINIKIDEFLKSHSKEFKQYRKNILQSYTSYDVNFDAFEQDSSLQDFQEHLGADIGTFFEEMDEIKGIGKLISYNPIHYCYMIKNMFRARSLSAVEMGTIAMKDQIASPKIKTIEQEGGKWKIYLDHYTSLYEFDYDLDSAKLRFSKFYKRK